MPKRRCVAARRSGQRASTTLAPETSSDSPAVRLAAAGDVGTGGEAAHRTGAIIDEQEALVEYDALLLLGDNVYPNGDPAELQRAVFDPFAPVLDDGTELLAVVGNTMSVLATETPIAERSACPPAGTPPRSTMCSSSRSIPLGLMTPNSRHGWKRPSRRVMPGGRL